MNEIIHYSRFQGKAAVTPAHSTVKSWSFPEDEEDEAALAHFLAVVASKNGVSPNELQHLFPAVLRLVKSTSSWSGQATFTASTP